MTALAHPTKIVTDDSWRSQPRAGRKKDRIGSRRDIAAVSQNSERLFLLSFSGESSFALFGLSNPRLPEKAKEASWRTWRVVNAMLLGKPKKQNKAKYRKPAPGQNPLGLKTANLLWREKKSRSPFERREKCKGCSSRRGAEHTSTNLSLALRGDRTKRESDVRAGRPLRRDPRSFLVFLAQSSRATVFALAKRRTSAQRRPASSLLEEESFLG